MKRQGTTDYLHRQMPDPVAPLLVPGTKPAEAKVKPKRKRRPVAMPSELPPGVPKPKGRPPE